MLSARQLNGPGPDNPLQRWVQRGLLEPRPADDELLSIPTLARWTDRTASPELRVRSYLDVHCAACHQPAGAARGFFDARFSTPLPEAGIVNGNLAAGDLGIVGAKVVVPGSPAKSILYRRLQARDFFRMPPVQFHNETSPILPVLEEWIRSLK